MDRNQTPATRSWTAADLLRGPNPITLSRVLLVGVLWWMALVGRDQRLWQQAFALVFTVTVLTDSLDGWVARRWKLETRLGALLDNIADTTVFLSLPGWVYLVLPELVRQNQALIVLIVAVYLTDLALQYLTCHRRVPLHLLSGKIMSWVLYVFIIWTLVFGLNELFKWVTFGTIFFSMFEELFLICTRRDLDETVISAFTSRRRCRVEHSQPE